MAPSSKKEQKGGKRKAEKAFHPLSRKADQLNRSMVRKTRMGDIATKKHKRLNTLVDVYSFFHHALPPEDELPSGQALSLNDLHELIRDVWLARFDSELEQEQSTRRKGRPKSARETKIEEIKLRETEMYRTGMEVLDLTDPTNVTLLRRWDQTNTGLAFVEQLRYIRITSENPETAVLTREGSHAAFKV